MVQTAIRLNADDLTADVIKGIKALFKHKEIEIIVRETNESTDYLFGHPANRAVLLKRMDQIEDGGELVTVSIEELERLAHADD